MRRLDVGCGKQKEKNFTHYLDKFKYGFNKVFDLESGKKLPYKTNFFDFINCRNTLEHLNNVEFVMREIHRILKVGGKVKITVPYYRHPNAVQPLHKRYFSWQSMNYWTNIGEEMCLEGNPRFKLISKEWIWEDPKLEKILGWFAKKNPLKYERFVAVFFPARRIEMVFEKVL